MYDIFYVSKDHVNEKRWTEFQKAYPFAIKLENVRTLDRIRKKSFTKMFWVVWDDILFNYSFDLNSHKATEWDDQYIHVFKNGEFYDGICLFPKNKIISKKEFDHRFFVHKKEIDVVASKPKPYDKFIIKTYDEYLGAIESSTTEMFWVVWNDIIIDKEFNFDYRVQYHNRDIVHVFKNGEFYDGICLFPKNKIISKKEFDYRFFTEKKEIDIVASSPKQYNRFDVSNYDEYLGAIESSTTEMFWVVWNDIIIDKEFNFDYRVQYHNRDIVHVFKNGEFYDGICLFPKNKIISKKEFDHRFFVHKKEIDVVASRHQKYDIVFMSYQESFADENYKKLLDKNLSNNIYRVDGVKGIHQAHVEAAKKVSTDLFYVVDADADIVPSFKFDYQIPYYDFSAKNTVYVWRSQNAINGLIYGYGGVKLLPTKLTLNMDVTRPDMTTSISKSFKAVQQLSNITAFNTDAYNTWRSAFRECAKLSSKIIDRQKDAETLQRLDVWCSVGGDKPFGKYAIEGAIAGKQYGEDNKSNLEALKKINDFDWLKSRYTEIYG